MNIPIEDQSSTYIARIQPYVSAGVVRYEMDWINLEADEEADYESAVSSDFDISVADYRAAMEEDNFQERDY